MVLGDLVSCREPWEGLCWAIAVDILVTWECDLGYLVVGVTVGHYSSIVGLVAVGHSSEGSVAVRFTLSWR